MGKREAKVWEKNYVRKEDDEGNILSPEVPTLKHLSHSVTSGNMATTIWSRRVQMMRQVVQSLFTYNT